MYKMLCTLAIAAMPLLNFAQVTISGGSTANGSYTTLAAAVTALNGSTITGPVTVDVVAGHTETLTGRITLTATGTAANPIVIQKSGSGANPVLTAYVGTVATPSVIADGFFVLAGSDYVTIDGINLAESAGNTTTTTVMEFGYGLFKASATDGCRNNVIRNCTITLNRLNNTAWTAPGHNGSTGIAVLNGLHTATGALTITAPSGSNSFNQFYGNTIQNCNAGVVFIGFGASAGVGPNPDPETFLGDLNNDVGGNTTTTGNSVLNFGGAASATNPATGIFANNQWSFNCSYNIINNNDGGGVNHVSTLRAIFLNSSSTSASANCNFNTITIKGGGTTSQVAMIENAFGSTPLGNTININNNTLTGDYLTATTGVLYGIYNNSATPSNLNINNNTISNFSYSAAALTGSGQVYPIYTLGSNASMTLNANGNNISNISRTGTTGGTTIGMFISGGTTGMVINANNNNISNFSIGGAGTSSIMYGIQTPTGTISVNNNNVNNLQCTKTTGTGALYGIYNLASPTNENYNDNTVSQLIHAGTGIVYGIYAFTTSGMRNMIGNTVFNLSTAGTTIAGINSASSSPNIYNNKIYNISSTNTAPTVSGIIQGSLGTSGTANIYNNIIGDLRAPAAASTTSPSVRGINITTATSTANLFISFNTVRLDANSTGSNFSTAGLYVTTSATSTTANLTLRNNIIVNSSAAIGTGFAAAYWRSTTALNNYNSASNNNIFFAGTPGPGNVIFYDGTNADQTISAYRSRVAPADNVSVSENPPFLSTNGSSPDFLHIDPAIATQVESGGVAIAGITTDFDGNTRSATPDVGADEGNFTILDLSAPSISYTQLTSTCSTGDYTLPNVTIGDGTGIPLSGTLIPRIYYRKNAGTWFSQPGTLVSGTSNSSIWNFTIVAGDMGGVAIGDNIQYYVIAQDIVTPINIGSNPAGVVATDVNTIVTHPATPNTYSINPTISGTINVGTGQTYNTLTDAVAAYNGSCISGPTTFLLTDSSYPSETFPISINQNIGASNTNRLTIRPANGVTATISGVSASCIIRLNGADFVTIDGSNNNGTDRNLTISNTSTSSATASVCLQSLGAGMGSTNNIIKNANVSCGVDQTASTSATFGIISHGSTISTSNDGADNDNNQFLNNFVTKSRFGIYVRGISSNPNDNINILNNLVGPGSFGSDQIGQAGIVIQHQNNAVVSQNEVRFVGGTIATTGTGADRAGIGVGDFAWTPSATVITNSRITENKIHDIVEERTFSAVGIVLSGSGTPSNNIVANNMIYGLLANGTAGDQTVGLGIAAGNGDMVAFNSIRLSGDLDPGTSTSTSVNSAGIRISSSTPSNLSLRNNIISVDLTSNTTTLKHFGIVAPATSYTWGTGIANHNDYWINASNLQMVLGGIGTSSPYTDVPSLNSWKTQFTPNQDANSLDVQPVFVSPTDLHLNDGSNNSLDKPGTSGNSILNDIDGNFRPAIPTIGAHELNPYTCAVTVTNVVASNYCGNVPSGSITITATCNGCTLEYSIDNGATWQSSNTFSGLAAGTNYQIKARDAVVTWCEDSWDNNPVTIISIPIPNVGITITETSGTTANDGTICNGDQATLTASGGGTYVWSTGATTTAINVTPSTSTAYTVTVTTNGCSETATATVTVLSLPTITFAIDENSGTEDDGTICSGNSVTITAGGASTYQWSSGQSTASITVTPGSTTTYSVTATATTGCSNTASTTITVNQTSPAPVIEISNNTCPSTIGVIRGSGCAAGSTLEWATNPNGPWQIFTPNYTNSALTVYARCNNYTTGCISSVSSATTAPVTCPCPLIEVEDIIYSCTEGRNYEITICFTANNITPDRYFSVNVGSQTFGLFEYVDYESTPQGRYCVTVGTFRENLENNVPVTITDYGINPQAPTLDGDATVESAWGEPVAISDGVAGWAGVNVGNLHVRSDIDYVYFGVKLNQADGWQSWGFAANVVDNSGGTSEVWTYPIQYGHSQSPDFVVKGNFGGYAELRTWNGTGWVRRDNNNTDNGLNTNDFEANPSGMIEVRIKKSLIGDPNDVEVQFYVSGNNQYEHATFDAVPDDQVATSWNHNGQGGNPPATVLDRYTSPVVMFAPITCTINDTYNETLCVTCPPAPLVNNVSYCVGDIATALTATTQFDGQLIWYSQQPAQGVQPLPGAPTPNTSQPGITTYWVTEFANECEGPFATIQVRVGETNILSVNQECSDPSRYALTVCFEAFNPGNAGQYYVQVGIQQFGPYLYSATESEEENTYCVTIQNAGSTLLLENNVQVVVKDDGEVANQTPVIDGIFDGAGVWGAPVNTADQNPGWAGANAKKLYVRQDNSYVYLGAEVEAASWQAWAFLINSQSGGGTFDSWYRAIDYQHTNGPDKIFRGTFGGYAELHTWNGSSWDGYFSQPNTEYGVTTSWVETRILKSALSNPFNVDVQFYITGDNNDHGSFDAVPNDDNANSWNMSGNRSPLNNYSEGIAIENPGTAMCMDMTTFNEASCGSFSISDPCVCNNNATPAQNDGTFNEVITVTGPSGVTITANCPLCTPNSISFTEVSSGIYVSQTFTHVDNVGYTATILANGSSIHTISNKCAYPNVAVDPIGPFTNCRNQEDESLIAVITGDNGSGPLSWAGPGVSGSSFNPSNVPAGIAIITATYDGVNGANISPDGGITAAYPGCIQTDTIQVTIIQSVLPPDIDPITVCEGGSTLIVAGTITPGVGTQVNVTYNFEGETPAGTSSNPGLVSGLNTLPGPGVSSITYPLGCGSADAYSANSWTQPTEVAAVSNGDYIEFTVSNPSATNTLVIQGFSFKGRISSTGPTNWALYNSTNSLSVSGTTTALSTPVPCGSYSANTLNVSIAPGGSASLRIYAWGNTQTAGTFRIDDIVINATSTTPSNNFKFFGDDPEILPNTPMRAMGASYDPMTTLENSPQSIWVVECAPDGCVSLPTEVVITVLEQPEFDYTPIAAVCAPRTINVLELDLNPSPAGGILTYHNTLSDAQNGVNPITSGLNAVSSTRTIWARYTIENGCYAIQEMIITITPRPTPPSVNNPAVACDGATPVITVNTGNIPATFTWDFETGINGQGISNNPALALNGPTQTVGSGLTGVGFQGAGSGCTNAITSTNYDITNTTLADAVADLEYFEFCIGASQPGAVFTGVSNITFRNRASGTGPITYALVASNNLTNVLATGTVGTTGCTLGGGNISLNSATCYRVYYYGATSTGGTLRIDNVVITALYVNDAIYRFYNVNPETNPNANPIFTGTSFNTGVTLATSPRTFWVNCTNPLNGCTSLPVEVSAIVYPNQTVTVANACIGGGTVTFTQNGGQQGTWSVSGGGTINPVTGEFTPTTIGCYTASFNGAGGCTDSRSFIVFPANPTAPVVSNTCNTSVIVPALPAVAGFTPQYSYNGGFTWTTSNISPANPGCYSIRTRYVLTSACGQNPAGTAPPAACGQSPESNAVIFPPAPAAPQLANSCNAPIVVPVLQTYQGFAAQYSYDDGLSWSNSNQSPYIPGCYTVRTRYVTSGSCGNIAAGTTAPAGCTQSNSSQALVFPRAPQITMPAVVCMSDFQLPVVDPVAGFNIEYSINGGAFVQNPLSSMTPGCYIIIARYTLSSACGSVAAGTPGFGSCAVSNSVTSKVLPVPDVVNQPDILKCEKQLISPLAFTSTTTVPACLNTSIVYKWTNNNPALGLPASGTGNIAPFQALTTGIAYITVYPEITVDGKTCYGQSQTFRIVIHEPKPLACNDNLFISLDDNCSAESFIDLFLEGEYNYFFYSVKIKTVTGAVIKPEDVKLFRGVKLIYEIHDNCDQISCWGYVTFEDKTAPEITCQDVTINCLESERLNLPLSSPDFVAKPTAWDNCGDAAGRMKFTETRTGTDCNRTVVRRWTTTDGFGNTSTECVQTIRVAPVVFDEINLPEEDILLNCNAATDPESIATATGNLNAGYPTLVLGGKTYALSTPVCNLSCTYTDEEIDICGSDCDGNKKIIRTWVCLDWCTDSFSQPFVQVITAMDTEAPSFILKDITVSTTPGDCDADFKVPAPWELHDNCDSKPTYSVEGPGIVSITGNSEDGYVASGATVGKHTFCYTAYDCCGNTFTSCMQVTVIDKTSPVPVVKQNVVLGLTPGGPVGDGNAKLFVSQVDNGSFDNCTNVKIEIRRPEGAPSCGNNGVVINGNAYNNNITYNNNIPILHLNDNPGDTDGGQFVSFCCEDLTTGVDIDGDGEINIGYHEVIIRVWDDGDYNGQYGSAGDNYNELSAYVKVEDKAIPIITCPPAMTIYCDWPITLSTDLGSGAQPADGVDFTKTGVAIGWGTCGELPIRFRDNVQVNQCGIGSITRDFFVGDAPVNQAPSCRQNIKVDPSTSSIVWTVTPPSSSKVSVSCDGPTDAQIAANKPTWIQGPCDVIGYSTQISQFDFEDGVCRKWIVQYDLMNWCTNEAKGPYYKEFVYSDTQNPVLESCEPLVYEVGADCSAQVVLSKSATDEGGCIDNGWLKWVVLVDLWGDGTDDYEFTSFLAPGNDVANANNGRIDLIKDDNGNGIKDIYVAPTSNGAAVSIKLPESIVGNMSNHKVTWKVSDGCHNYSACYQDFMVTDKKAPTPYCVSLSTALMEDPDGNGPLRPTVEVRARDFNVGSFDNCTASDDLLYTFDNWAPQIEDKVVAGKIMNINTAHYFDVNGGVMTYPTTNVSILNRYNNGELQLWLPLEKTSAKVWTDAIFAPGQNKEDVDVIMTVWDAKLNRDFCIIKLTIVCNSCDVNGGSRLSGVVMTEQSQGVNNAEVTLRQTNGTSVQSAMTNSSGAYELTNAEPGSYELTVTKDTDYMNGVSTFDIVLIQRHMLGIEELGSPYKIIAADANNDMQVNTIDLVQLRRLILGVSSRFDNQSWRFADASSTMNMSNIFPYIDKKGFEIYPNANLTNLNFMAVKIGDVNGNATNDVQNPEIESRNASQLVFNMEERMLKAGEIVEIPVKATDYKDVLGYQMTWKTYGAEIVEIKPGAVKIDQSHCGAISADVMTMSYASSKHESFENGEILFTLSLKALQDAPLSQMITINSDITATEAYAGIAPKVMDIRLELTSVAAEDVKLFQNEPNPFRDLTRIAFFMPVEGDAKLSVYDVSGKMVVSRNLQAEKGMNQVTFTQEQLGQHGVLYYTLETGQFTETKKMIILE